jgi:4-hydroxy-3-methylbut-2-enyl diphosphate reductase
MKLLVAQSAGFCFGVKRAMEMALEAVKKHPKDLYSLGPLIHNPQAVTFLDQLGVKAKNRIESIRKGTVIFRSHGVSLKDCKAKRKVEYYRCDRLSKAQFFAKFLTGVGIPFLLILTIPRWKP